MLRIVINAFRRRKFLISGAVLSLFTIMSYYKLMVGTNHNITGEDSSQSLANAQTTTKRSRPNIMEKKDCVQPYLKPFHFTPSKRVDEVNPYSCNIDEEWLTVENGSVYISKGIGNETDSIKCTIRYIIRESETSSFLTKPIQLLSNHRLRLSSDFFKADCYSTSGKEYHKLRAAVHFSSNTHARHPDVTSGLGLDVILIWFKAISHMQFIRKLPKSYSYFRNELNGSIFNGYSTVGKRGENSLLNVLTGKHDEELSATPTDSWPFIWRSFRKQGYVTAFAEDQTEFETTNSILHFKKQPTDHYLADFFLLNHKVSEALKYQSMCNVKGNGTNMSNSIFLNYIKQFYTMYARKRKFIFGVHGTIDTDRSMEFDNNLYQTLKHLNDEAYLNNTMLVLLSDRGFRFAPKYSKLQHILEERLPLLGMSFPRWFRQKRHAMFDNVRENKHLLVTPFDVYSTLQHVLFFNDITTRKTNGQSLFESVPLTRHCQDVGVKDHWCTCFSPKPISRADYRSKNVAYAALRLINQMTSSFRKECAFLKLDSITAAQQYLPDRISAPYIKRQRRDFELSVLRILVLVTPVSKFGVFQVTASTEYGDVTLTDDIKRLDTNRDTGCISDPSLQDYCFCKR